MNAVVVRYCVLYAKSFRLNEFDAPDPGVNPPVNVTVAPQLARMPVNPIAANASFFMPLTVPAEPDRDVMNPSVNLRTRTSPRAKQGPNV